MSRPRPNNNALGLSSSPVAGGGGRSSIFGRSYALAIRRACHYWRVRHPMDSLYVDEFKLESGQRIDSVVIDLRTFAIRGFEIKTSRADFLKDKKWHLYLPYVSEFYFATPPGLLEPAEIPERVGLVELHGAHLREVKKAQSLQTFVRRTYGEQYITRTLVAALRALTWILRERSK